MKVFASLFILFIFASPLQAAAGDFNNDGKVDFTDFIILAGNFGKEGDPEADCAALIGDLNCDSKVDFTDFITFVGNFRKEGEPGSEDQKHLQDLKKETTDEPTIAFPGAEGYGRFAQGGRGGDVYIVTDLSDDGVGSLRYGIGNMNGPRTIVFAVSGTIELDSAIKITDSHLTIAGQTAPGDGICIKHYGLDIQNVINIIMRYIRIRTGDQNKGTSTGEECLKVKNSNDIIFDHISAGWGIDSIQDTRGVGNYTLQWSI